jgi:excisionase family DNA binding protein
VAGELTLTLPPELLDELVQRVADELEVRGAARRADESRRWLTIPEAAEYLRCKPQRVYNLRSAGRLSRYGDGGRALVDRRELDRLVEDAGS